MFSAGPYMLKGAWTRRQRAAPGCATRAGTGPATRCAGRTPTRSSYQEGLDTQTVAQQLMADGDTGRVSVSLGSAPPAIQQHITAVASLEERSVNPRTGVVDYLVPNARSKVFADEKVRLALAAATNRDAYVTAIGGATAADPAMSLVPKSLPAAHESDPVGAGTRGDAAKAKAMLTQAGVTTAGARSPWPTARTRRPTRRWRRSWPAGAWPGSTRRPSRSPTTTSRRSATPQLADQVDVFWSNWAPAWASASTILPPLFDSSINITKVGPGRDYGYWADKDLDARMAKVNTIADRTRP